MGCGNSSRCFSRRRKGAAYEDDSSSVRSSVSEIYVYSSSDTKKRKKKKKQGRASGFLSLIFQRCRRNRAMSMTKIERTMKAALLIQKWYRRYMARIEVRRRYTWTIFQSIEYAEEQDQLKLYNFFDALLMHIRENNARPNSSSASKSPSLESLHFEDESEDEEDVALKADKKFKPLQLNFPMKRSDVDALIEAFRRKRHHKLHPSVVGRILKEGSSRLKKLPNFNLISTAVSKQVTVCGDLHGKLDDLLIILHKNGLPSTQNPYVFNGDFVDRGKKSLEVLLLLLSLVIVFPGAVFLNRGNHEDLIMNQRYGFIKEVQSKYKKNSEKILKLIEDVYRWLPLGTIVNNKVFIVHGGLSNTIDLDVLKKLEREKYTSLLRPPLAAAAENGKQGEGIDRVEWKQIFDILWSDPQPGEGCIPNKLRGAGTYFGPDVTNSFLEKNNLWYVIRSHECKLEGYEIMHNNKVITIFSASNYYEEGSNRGSYMKLTGPKLVPHYVQYMSVTGKSKRLTFRQRIGLVESSAIRELKEHITSNNECLMEGFKKADTENSGMVKVSVWCEVMEKGTGLNLPWRLLRDKLASLDEETQMVVYSTTFRKVETDLNTVQTASTVVDTLYRNKSNLETVFRLIDKDNSGYISLSEFSDACDLINKHMPNPITKEQLLKFCSLMDMNKDGMVDLNEFLEAFRLVDQERSKLFGSGTGEENLTEDAFAEDRQLNGEKVQLAEITIECTDF